MADLQALTEEHATVLEQGEARLAAERQIREQQVVAMNECPLENSVGEVHTNADGRARTHAHTHARTHRYPRLSRSSRPIWPGPPISAPSWGPLSLGGARLHPPCDDAGLRATRMTVARMRRIVIRAIVINRQRQRFKI